MLENGAISHVTGSSYSGNVILLSRSGSLVQFYFGQRALRLLGSVRYPELMNGNDRTDSVVNNTHEAVMLSSCFLLSSSCVFRFQHLEVWKVKFGSFCVFECRSRCSLLETGSGHNDSLELPVSKAATVKVP